MTRTLPSGVPAVAVSAAHNAILAVELLTPTPIRVTNAPQGAAIGGHAYTYGYLGVSGGILNDQPSGSVRLSNAGNALTTADFVGWTAHGALEGLGVTVYEVFFDATGAQLGEVTRFVGIVMAFVADGATGELTVASREQTSAGYVGRICSRLCCYKFKGARCAYAGAATSCDHSFAACTALSNTARFGGYRTMPTLNTRLSYWVTQYVPAAVRFGSSVPQAQSNPSSVVAPRVRPHIGMPPPKEITGAGTPERIPFTITEGERGHI